MNSAVSQAYPDIEHSNSQLPFSARKSVLLIEDSEDAMLLVRQALHECRRGQYNLKWTKTLEDGLRELYESSVDLVVLDLGLPESSGFFSYVLARDYAKHVPIIVLTADDSYEMKNSILAAGANHFLSKQGISRGLLIETIESVLAKNAIPPGHNAVHPGARQKQVLLIEDDMDAMLLVQSALHRHGNGKYSFAWANNLRSGLDCLAKGDVDIVLLDVGLPDSTGPTGYQRIRAVAPGVPVLVLTGGSCVETEFAAISNGVDDYLEKPQTGRGLLEAIGRALFEARRQEDARIFGGEAFRRVSNTFWGM